MSYANRDEQLAQLKLNMDFAQHQMQADRVNQLESPQEDGFDIDSGADSGEGDPQKVKSLYYGDGFVPYHGYEDDAGEYPEAEPEEYADENLEEEVGEYPEEEPEEYSSENLDEDAGMYPDEEEEGPDLIFDDDGMDQNQQEYSPEMDYGQENLEEEPEEEESYGGLSR